MRGNPGTASQHRRDAFFHSPYLPHNKRDTATDFRNNLITALGRTPKYLGPGGWAVSHPNPFGHTVNKSYLAKPALQAFESLVRSLFQTYQGTSLDKYNL